MVTFFIFKEFEAEKREAFCKDIQMHPWFNAENGEFYKSNLFDTLKLIEKLKITLSFYVKKVFIFLYKISDLCDVSLSHSHFRFW